MRAARYSQLPLSPGGSTLASRLDALRSSEGGRTSSIEKGQRTESVSGPTDVSEEEIALRFTERLRFFAAKRLNDASAAEDVAQETLRVVVDAIRANRIENRDALPGFVFQTARNICLHWVRSTAREKSAFARLEREPASEGTHPDALVNLVSAERAQMVKAALNRLSAEDKRLLTMIYYADLGSDDIALTLGVTTAAVRVRKHRALQRLAAELGDTAGNETDPTGTLE
jgi:RNA polymerase sigma factor (sigma-70 family)